MELPAPAQNSSNTGERAVRPRIVVSQCLGLAAVRYNGEMLDDSFVPALQEHVELVPVCPEVGIGLGVPRDPIRIVEGEGTRQLVQPSTGADLTQLMHCYAEQFLTQVGDIDGFILKSRSPSCGIDDVKIFASKDDEANVGTGSGLFTENVLKQFPHAAIQDEGRLADPSTRHSFLVHVFARARFRVARERGALRALGQFHAQHKMQYMAKNPKWLGDLGRLVANLVCRSAAEVFVEYEKLFTKVMAVPDRPARVANALLHAFGHLSPKLSPKDRRTFLRLVDDYRKERIPITAALGMLRSCAIRFEDTYLMNQSILDPYPAALMSSTAPKS